MSSTGYVAISPATENTIDAAKSAYSPLCANKIPYTVNKYTTTLLERLEVPILYGAEDLDRVTKSVLYTKSGKLSSNTDYSLIKVPCRPGDVMYIYYGGANYGAFTKIFCNVKDNHNALSVGDTNKGFIESNSTSGNIIIVPDTPGITVMYAAVRTSKLGEIVVYRGLRS
jgi:hypothetical protein